MSKRPERARNDKVAAVGNNNYESSEGGRVYASRRQTDVKLRVHTALFLPRDENTVIYPSLRSAISFPHCSK